MDFVYLYTDTSDLLHSWKWNNYINLRVMTERGIATTTFLVLYIIILCYSKLEYNIMNNNNNYINTRMRFYPVS